MNLLNLINLWLSYVYCSNHIGKSWINQNRVHLVNLLWFIQLFLYNYIFFIVLHERGHTLCKQVHRTWTSLCSLVNSSLQWGSDTAGRSNQEIYCTNSSRCLADKAVGFLLWTGSLHDSSQWLIFITALVNISRSIGPLSPSPSIHHHKFLLLDKICYAHKDIFHSIVGSFHSFDFITMCCYSAAFFN